MLLNVDDIKQYIYCKRIPFYTHILNSVDKPFLVNYGTKFERNIDLDSIIKIVNNSSVSLRVYSLPEEDLTLFDSAFILDSSCIVTL